MTDGLLHDNVHKPQGVRISSRRIDLIDCPCCGSGHLINAFSAAPSVIRGLVVEAIDKLGIYNQRQIADLLGWNRSTVRALLWYRRHVAR